MNATRRFVIPLLVIAAVIIGLWGYNLAAGLRPVLGLDLKGGTSVTFQPKTPSGGTPSSSQIDTTVNIMRNRVDALGVSNAEVSTQGGNIVVALPSVKNPDQVIAAVKTTAQLRMRPVLAASTFGSANYNKPPYSKVNCARPKLDTDITGNVVLCQTNTVGSAPTANATKLLLGPVALGGTDIAGASAQEQTSGNGVVTGGWQTQLNLSGTGSSKFQTVTGKLACFGANDVRRQLAITLDGVVINAPPMATDVVCNQGIAGGTAEITGQTQQEAQTLAPLIATGALPLELAAISRQTVSATLGNYSLRAGLIAGAIGVALVFLYVLLFYRGLGLVVWTGLILSGLINVGLVILFGQLITFTLTLAGIAGLIVAVGISADSYIVFYERLKDEVRDGRTIRASVERGWKRGFRTIISADTVSFTAAVILYIFAIGDVRGFAFTLGMATLIDVFTAWFFTRPAVTLLTRTRLFQEGAFIGIRAAAGVEPPTTTTTTPSRTPA